VTGQRPSLADLHGRVRAARDAAALRRLEAELRSDPRRGARLLAGLCARRRADAVAERRRLARLFAPTRRLRRQGVRCVAGVDEVGVGPLAGPVVAAAVVLPERADLPGLDDSKRLAAAQRERLAEAIRGQALAWAVAELEPEEVDRLNVLRASLEAMRRAVTSLGCSPQHVLVDARRIPGIDVPQTALVHGDARDASIAAASVLAKVHRDALMCRLDERFPGYGFAEHKGYGTARHLAALRRLGPSPAHRRSFSPVAQLPLL
jgi:ribonuclease HII